MEEQKAGTLSKEVITQSTMAINPVVASALTAHTFSSKIFGELDTKTLFVELFDQSKAVNRNELNGVEQMLYGQAVALNVMFNEFAVRAANADQISKIESYMRLSLKAQAQSRATLQTIAEIKNPRPVAFVKQQNIANGHQQVNNGVTPAPARTEESESTKNELLEVNHGKRLDTRATSKAIDADPAMATLGEIDGAANL
ncbi:MAG: hypothetical protein ABTQ26_12285 [Azonexus sp.]